LSANIRWKGASPANQCWCPKIRVIALLSGIKISSVGCFVTKHACERQMDGQLRQLYCASMWRTVKIIFQIIFLVSISIFTNPIQKTVLQDKSEIVLLYKILASLVVSSCIKPIHCGSKNQTPVKSSNSCTEYDPISNFCSKESSNSLQSSSK